jgi:hypothetical protein
VVLLKRVVRLLSDPTLRVPPSSEVSVVVVVRVSEGVLEGVSVSVAGECSDGVAGECTFGVTGEVSVGVTGRVSWLPGCPAQWRL